MTLNRYLMVALGALLFLTLAAPAQASHESRRRIRVRGVVVSLHSQANSFFLQEPRHAGDRLWVVQINGHAGIGRDRDDDDDDDDDNDDRDHHRTRFRFPNVGDVVRVEGRTVGSQHILADEIEIVGHVRGPISTGGVLFPQPPFPTFPQPPFPLPPGVFLHAPEILSPHNGADIAVSEFTIIGRATPGVQVHIDVLAHFTVFQVTVASADVVADHSGLFTYTVRPPMRVAGTIYRITATGRFPQGVVSPPTSIVVRQL